jgi:hypothetical protein
VTFTTSLVAAGLAIAVVGSVLIGSRPTSGLLMTGFGAGWAAAVLVGFGIAKAMYRDRRPVGPSRDPHFASGGFR